MAYIPGMITNRPFELIDERFCLKLEDEIKDRAEKNTDLTVFDVGCGTEAEAITMLTVIYPSVKGIGIDYHLECENESERLILKKGDLFDIPFESVADIAYCAYVLPDISTEVYKEKIIDAVFQISKTLKKGGIAFIDEGVYASADYLLEELIKSIKEKHSNFEKNYVLSNDPDIGLMGNYLIVEKKE
ncbi:class I SAM-dependent methyltransferase [Candidatus Woesearchaeota archaeon]|nr:class I SAM-dependent methyltransferase [Candidatus Woesearchaeota archaeon]